MKKLVAIALLLSMVLGLCACGTAPGETTSPSEAVSIEGKFSVGFGRVNVTPEESVPLGGYGNTSFRLSTGFLDYLYTTCVAFTDKDGNTVLLYHNDQISSSASVFLGARQSISKATGIPVDNIMVSATHTHAAPDLGNNNHITNIRYKSQLVLGMVEAAKAALDDRKPAEMYIGEARPEGLNFVRHYKHQLADGTWKYFGDNFGSTVLDETTQHTSEADNQLQLVKFVRQGGQDVVLINWQSHPHRYGGSKKYELTADIVGAMREKMESELGCLFAYFSGGSGNVNPVSRIPEENVTSEYKTQGQKLAEYAIAAYPGLEKAETGRVQIINNTYKGTVNHSMDHLVSVAYKVQQIWTSTNNSSLAMAEGKAFGINSVYHAGGIISKSGMGEFYNVEMYAFSIGDVGFVTAPYEMFDTNGKEIKDGSPFKATFVITCANDGIGYIPSQLAYDHGCYGADTGKFVPGTGEILAQEYVKMLETLHKTK